MNGPRPQACARIDRLARVLAWGAFALALLAGIAGLFHPPEVPLYERSMERARNALNAGDFGEARKYYRFALTVNGDDEKARRGRETATRLQKVETTGAEDREAWLRKTRETRSDDPYVLLYAAESARLAGRIDEALTLYRRALAVEPALDYASERLASLAGE